MIKKRKSVQKSGFTPINSDGNFAKRLFQGSGILCDCLSYRSTGQFVTVHTFNVGIDGRQKFRPNFIIKPSEHSLAFYTAPEVLANTCITWTVATGRGCLWS